MNAVHLFSARTEDLALTGKSARELTRRGLIGAVLATFGTVALLGLSGTVGVMAGPVGVVLLPVTSGAAAYAVPFQRCRAEATMRRRHIDMSAAIVLDLVNVQMAGGCGMETALVTAVGVGTGDGFRVLQESISRSHAARSSYWDGLQYLGTEWGVSSLIDIANSGQIAGMNGARVRQSMSARAAALRSRNLAALEEEAQRRTEQMGLPMVILFLSFLSFVGYPALAQTMSSL
jgi:hypothetical protein